MAVTSTQTHRPASTAGHAIGRYLDTGAAAAFTITCGFRPRYVMVENIPDRTRVEWYDGMADAEAQLTLANGDRTNITTLGITPTATGFTLGLELNVNVSNKQLSWIAVQ